jgi:hypothetical protein
MKNYKALGIADAATDFWPFKCSCLGTRNFRTTQLFLANKNVFESEHQDEQIGLLAPTKRNLYKLRNFFALPRVV